MGSAHEGGQRPARSSTRARKSRDTCPTSEKHTPRPAGYLDWHEWAEEKSRTHKQTRCPGCGMWAIWTPQEQDR